MLKQNFITSYLTFYLKASVGLDGDFVKVSNPNTILKLIPLGANNKTIAVSQIASVSSNFSLDIKSLAWGVLFVFLGASNLDNLMNLLLLVYGVLTVLSAFETKMDIHNTSGQVVTVSAIIFEKARLLDCMDTIEKLISQRQDDTNVAKHVDKIVEVIQNK